LYDALVERIDLMRQVGGEVVQTWRTGWVQSPFTTAIRVGRLADGRWYAQRAGRAMSLRDKRQGACVYGQGDRGELLARATARRWMRTVGGEWNVEA
jgi:hypothetical protein